MNKLEQVWVMKSVRESEYFARNYVAKFCSSIGADIEEIEDVKTAVGEAVLNAIDYAYNLATGDIILHAKETDTGIRVIVEDRGSGIPNYKITKKPFCTTRLNEDWIGGGFKLMQIFMNNVAVLSDEKGTKIIMDKSLNKKCNLVKNQNQCSGICF